MIFKNKFLGETEQILPLKHSGWAILFLYV